MFLNGAVLKVFEQRRRQPRPRQDQSRRTADTRETKEGQIELSSGLSRQPQKNFQLIFISELILQTKVNAFSKLYTFKMICGYTRWADWLKQFKKSHNFQYFVIVIARSLIIDFNLV